MTVTGPYAHAQDYYTTEYKYLTEYLNHINFNAIVLKMPKM